MKAVYTLLFTLTVLTALCSAKPSITKANLHGSLRVKRQAIMMRGLCPVYQARLIRKCISCDRFEEITGKNCPGDPKYFRRPKKSGNERNGTRNIKRLNAFP
ncbi:unnamed protein product [Arctia plantaginis]|uniref:Uncharacterized protein n=1 Tax=Arctia plantaginis TaxID=874455 RepID=A0A8S0Z573_ARCPL|nr:unnamed protein product [Arctia plantaginis]